MSITTYAELKAAITSWTDDGTEASDNADTYIDLAEAEFNRELRLREMEEEATVSLTSGVGNLPSDFLEMIFVESGTTPTYTLENIDRTTFANLETYSGDPLYYAIAGTTIKVNPTASSVPITYYESIPALSDSNTTNWLLTKYPMLYLVACEKHHAWKTRDYEAHDRAALKQANLISDLNSEDEKARYANVKLRTPVPSHRVNDQIF